MITKHIDIEEGQRFDTSIRVISRETIQQCDEQIHRLLIRERSGEEFSIFISPTITQVVELNAGDKYRISDLVGAKPVTSADDIEIDCTYCGGQLRNGTSIDGVSPAIAELTAELDRENLIGILDDSSRIHPISQTSDIVDDWMQPSERRSIAAPDFVCQSCGRHLSRHDVGRRGGSEDLDDGQVLEEMQRSPTPSAVANQETVGLAAGGSKDITNFRENIRNEYTPQPEAIADEGLFYDYYFETGESTATDALFAPRYATAVSEHPLTGDTEQYLSVGLDSTLSVDEFKRPRLDLVVVLDVSGSMDSSFDAYYYDKQGQKRHVENGASTKMEAATESLCALTKQLQNDDRFGVVLFNQRAHVVKPLREIETTDMQAIRRHIRDVRAGGGTNLSEGFQAAVDMLADSENDPHVEQRIVFLTDMMPNVGTTSEDTLTQHFSEAANNGINTTFIGMGLDANAELADALSGIRGANHYFIHSADEFERRLGEEFDYMVTPLVYDLDLELETEGCEIDAVHGSPTGDPSADRLMHIGTLFPSAKQDGEARGGVVLVRLEQTHPDAELELRASWTERNGDEHTESVAVTMPDEPELFAHDGVRKAVVLSRYARELRNWAKDVHERDEAATSVDDWRPSERPGRHERQSVPLVVPDRYGEKFDRLRLYLEDEMEQIGDETLEQELDLLAKLRREASPTSGVNV